MSRNVRRSLVISASLAFAPMNGDAQLPSRAPGQWRAKSEVVPAGVVPSDQKSRHSVAVDTPTISHRRATIIGGVAGAILGGVGAAAFILNATAYDCVTTVSVSGHRCLDRSPHRGASRNDCGWHWRRCGPWRLGWSPHRPAVSDRYVCTPDEAGSGLARGGPAVTRLLLLQPHPGRRRVPVDARADEQTWRRERAVEMLVDVGNASHDSDERDIQVNRPVVDRSDDARCSTAARLAGPSAVSGDGRTVHVEIPPLRRTRDLVEADPRAGKQGRIWRRRVVAARECQTGEE